MGTLLTPGTVDLFEDILFFLIPPITTISPSATNNFVFISIVLIPTDPGFVLSGVSLFTFTSNRTFPSPIILGVTVKTKAASLNVSWPSPPETGICTPCLI